MSAYIVSGKQINVLTEALCSRKYFSYVHRGKVRKLSSADHDRVANLLTVENYASVNFRYKFSEQAPKHIYVAPKSVHNPVEVYKLTRCLIYQSCDHGDKWQTSEACAMLTALAEDIGHTIINGLPEYDKAAWSI